MPVRISFEELSEADLTVGATYPQGGEDTIGAEPLHRLLPGVGNQGGFRAAGSIQRGTVKFVVLYTSGEDADWPDRLDVETGLFTYFGDNKVPGSELHATTRSGNRLLRQCFDALHGQPPQRDLIPPFFVFKKAVAGGDRSVEFIGLAVPGGRDIPSSEDLVAIWRTTDGQRFQNYRAVFTILDAAMIARDWIDELSRGEALGSAVPEAYGRFAQEGAYAPLQAPRTIDYRTPAEQEPATERDRQLVATIHEYFAPDPYAFEPCAIELWKMAASEAVTFIEGTRRSRDGGRDAIGLYSLGPQGDRIHLDFSLEAKCKGPGRLSGVRDTSRLISRLTHRQFGVFVTTSGLSLQAYIELREDRHPVVILCARDIAEILNQHDLGSVGAVRAWLQANFPMPA